MRSEVAGTLYSANIRIPKRNGLKYTKIIGKISTYKRSGIEIKEGKKALDISITADDITALRASMNSIMRDLQVVEQVVSL
jgi:tRNA threonylcarbamoyladenosine modification (KEOPS) complex  Pcc1 subunit